MSQYELISDEALIEAVQRGDGDAAAHLYHRHIDRVHRICYRIVLDHSQVQDCVQEVWLKVFRNLGRFRCQRSFAAWLNSVTANTAIDYYRRSRRRSGHVDLDDPRTESLEIEPHADDRQLDDATIRRRIQDALEEITVSQRTAFVLRVPGGHDAAGNRPRPQVPRRHGPHAHSTMPARSVGQTGRETESVKVLSYDKPTFLAGGVQSPLSGRVRVEGGDAEGTRILPVGSRAAGGDTRA